MHDLWRAFLLAKNQWGRRTIVGISMLVDSGSLILIPLLLKQIFDALVLHENYTELSSKLNQTVAILFILAGLRAIAIYAQIYFQEGTGNYIGHDIRKMLFQKLLRLPFSFFDRTKTGNLMSVLTKDVDAVRDGTGFVIMLVIINILTAIGIISTMLHLHYQFAIVILSVFPILGVIAYLYSVKIKPLYDTVQRLSGDLHTVAQENISGIRVVKAFVRQTQEQKKFSNKNNSLYQTNIKIAYISSVIHPSLDFLGGAASLLALGVGGFYVIQGNMTLGTVVAFTIFTEFLIWPIRQVGWLAEMFQRAIAGAKRIYRVLDEEDNRVSTGAHDDHVITGAISFHNVSFSYPNGKLALSNFSLHIEPGQKVCVLGMTGSGKTTLVNLLPRYYDATAGKITIDGIDLTDWSLEALRNQIGFVFQDNFLFSASLADNLTMGLKDVSLSLLQRSVEAAQAGKFIEKLPEGFNTLVGERGIGLSGGEKQRIAIGRALLRDPKILVFDDSTASLDAKTEAALKSALETLFTDRTVLIVAQRVSTAMSADHIVVLDSGEIVEQGTHKELLAKNGIYAQLHQVQTTSANFINPMNNDLEATQNG